MTRHPNSDGHANPLKSQGENGPNPLIENQPRRPVRLTFAEAVRATDAELWAARITPRGGGRAEEGLPPSERPFSLSGQRRSEN